MTGLVFYAFAAFGLAYVVGHSTITKPFRTWLYGQDPADPIPLRLRRLVVDLVECPACFGFWTGVVAAAAGALDVEGPLMSIAWGLFTAGSNYALARVTKLI